MVQSDRRVLICSGRPEVVGDLTAHLEELEADASVAARPEAWPGQRPDLVFIDLADPAQSVREARTVFGIDAELIAIVDGGSVDSLLPAIAAGCSDYLFHPINAAELRLRWKRHVAGRGGDRPHRPAGLSGKIHLELPSSVGYVRHAVAEVVEACERLAFAGSRATLNLRVALGEVLANAILYGNAEDAGRFVHIDADLRPGTAVVTVTDEGPGFDPAAVLDPTLPENRDRSHGRGLFLLRTLADEVAFNDRGNAVTLTVRAPGA
ncbi:MAG: ATP-binding protein [Gemmatimonadota bacterium]